MQTEQRSAVLQYIVIRHRYRDRLAIFGLRIFPVGHFIFLWVHQCLFPSLTDACLGTGHKHKNTHTTQKPYL